MTGRRVAAITGASGGIGSELAALHARLGWDVLMVNRSVERSRPVVDRIREEYPGVEVDVIQADLADHDSIEAAAGRLNQFQHIDIFYNNAGVLLGEHVDSKYGVEMHAQVNTIAPYLFGRLLQPSLAGSTMLTVSTGGISQPKTLSVKELAEPSEFKKLVGPYFHSKLAAAALMDAFAQEYPDTIFVSVEPGAVKTEMTSGEGMPRLLVPVRNLFFSSPEKAARRIYDGAVDPGLAGHSGAFTKKGKIREVPAAAADPAVQAELLAWCRETTGV